MVVVAALAELGGVAACELPDEVVSAGREVDTMAAAQIYILVTPARLADGCGRLLLVAAHVVLGAGWGGGSAGGGLGVG